MCLVPWGRRGRQCGLMSDFWRKNINGRNVDDPAEPRWEQRTHANFLDQTWSLGERIGLGFFLILSKPGLSVGNPRLKMTMQCWGGIASKRKMHPLGLETTLNVPSKDFWRDHKRDHKLQSWLYTSVRPEGKDHFMTVLMNNFPFPLSASSPCLPPPPPCPFSSSLLWPLEESENS